MAEIDRVGSYIFEIVGSGFGTTVKGYPQWILSVKALKFWANSPDLLTYYKLDAPAWVDWDQEQQGIGYLCLFNSADNYDANTALLNAKQAQVAVGWDGSSFDPFADGTFIGKRILGRIEEHTYNEKTTLRLNWIDAPDANPERQIKSLDAPAIKALNSKLKFGAPPKAVGASAPVKAPPVPAAPVAASAAPAAAAPPQARPGRPPKNKAAAAVAAAATPPAPAAPPTEFATEAAAWEYAAPKKPDTTTDAEFADAWLSSRGEVAGDRDEAALTPADWAKVVAITFKDLAITA